jgi:Flp pilus assembly protein TadG
MKLIPPLFYRLFAAAADVARRLAVQREGNVLVLFAMASIPVIIAAGIAIDSARAYTIKQRLGSALDAAALAVGSQSMSATSTQLTTALNNYFYDNYCKKVPTGGSVTSCTSTVATEYNLSVQATTSITAATVTFSASATVPTTFMRLVGINSLPVTAVAQTTKFPGMEIAVVLDNTGSMLCGENEGAPSTCGADEDGATDTSCTDTNDLSRICTLRRASLQFISTLQAAITAPQSVYMSIVPFVTTVNVGNNSVYGGSNTGLCTTTGSTCSDLTTDATSGDYTDWRGNIMPVIPLTGTTTNASTSVSSVSFYGNGAYNSGTTPLYAGMNIYGHGVPSGTTISSASGTSLTLSSNASLSFTGNTLAAGPASASTNISTPYIDPTTFSPTGSWTNAGTTITGLSSATGVVAGMVVTSASSGIKAQPSFASTTVAASYVAGATTVPLSQATTAAQTNKTVTFSMAGTTTSGSTTVSTLKGSTNTLNSIVVGMPICGPGIAGSVSPCTTASTTSIPTTYVTSVTGSPPTSFTMSAAATSTNTNEIVTFWNLGATTNTGSTTVYNASFSALPNVGDIIVGNGIPANTTITAVTGNLAAFTGGTGQLTISQNATTPSNFSSATAPCPPSADGGPGGSNCYNTTLVDVAPIGYDATFNTGSPMGSSTSVKWGGCVVEPTSSAENLSGTGVLNSSTATPDTSEPASSTKWYPFYWVNDSVNGWTTAAAAQDYNTEPLATEDTSWQQNDGPNQGCPVPILPLTDMTTTAGQTILQNAINSMWPRDSGGTQVHVGAIWGWRTIAPGGPFAAVNGHPLSYSQATSTGWKKIMVLMTDGEEEAFTGSNMTGMGQLNDGKIDTTSASTAITNLGTRLSTVCTNMANDGIIIYTIGLGSGGSSNTQLQSCPANGGFFSAATTSNIASIFQQIAASIIHLRLTQ